MSDLIGDTAGSPNLGISDPATVGCPPSGRVTRLYLGCAYAGRAYAGSQLLTEALNVNDATARTVEPSRLASSPIMRLAANRYNSPSLALMLPNRVIPDHPRDEILEAGVSRAAEPESVYPLYMKHRPGYKCAELNVFKLQARHLEMFDVRWIRRYGPTVLAEEYNATADRPLKNTRLRCVEGEMSLEVDGAVSVGLTRPKFWTYQGELFVEAGLGDSARVKLTKGLKGYCVRTSDSSQVKSIAAAGSGILLTYARPNGRPHLRLCGNSQQMGIALDASMASMVNAIRIISRPEGFEGSYLVRVGNELRALVSKRLGWSPFERFIKRKGDVGEELADMLLSQIGCVDLKDHPDHEGARAAGSNRKGPDRLRRIPSGEPAYFEVKWWEDWVKAKSAAAIQLMRMARRNRGFGNEAIRGAYIAILVWNLEDEELSMIVERAW